jgi:hypothetical protein
VVNQNKRTRGGIGETESHLNVTRRNGSCQLFGTIRLVKIQQLIPRESKRSWIMARKDNDPVENHQVNG